jgi:hypothetical protein
MEWLALKLGPRVARVALWVIVVLLVIALLAIGKCVYDQRSRAALNASKNQTGAAFESGKAAINTIGNRSATEAEGATNVQEAQHAIDNATDPGVATDAGLAGLHRVRGKPTPGPRR